MKTCIDRTFESQFLLSEIPKVTLIERRKEMRNRIVCGQYRLYRKREFSKAETSQSSIQKVAYFGMSTGAEFKHKSGPMTLLGCHNRGHVGRCDEPFQGRSDDRPH